MHQVEQHPPEGRLMHRYLAKLGEVHEVEHDPMCGEGRGHLLRTLGHEQRHVSRDQLGRPHAYQGEIILEEIIHAREVRLHLCERLRDLGAGGVPVSNGKFRSR
jgi:hypothetical protein